MSAVLALIAGIIVSVVAGLIEFLAKYVTKKVAIVIAVVAAVVTVTGAFVGAVQGLLSSVEYAFPNLGPVFTFLPDNLSACFGAIISAKLLRWAYDWNVRFIQYKLV